MSRLFWCQWSHCILMKTPPRPHPCPRCWCWWEHHTFRCHLAKEGSNKQALKGDAGFGLRPPPGSRILFLGLWHCQPRSLKPLFQTQFPHLKMVRATASGCGLGTMEMVRACLMILIDS